MMYDIYTVVLTCEIACVDDVPSWLTTVIIVTDLFVHNLYHGLVFVESCKLHYIKINLRAPFARFCKQVSC